MATQINSFIETDQRDQHVRRLIARWKDDESATYRSSFLWDERLKNFRSIRRGTGQVVSEIEQGTFGVTYRGSSLETIVHSVAEQWQIFKGADHVGSQNFASPIFMKVRRTSAHSAGCSTHARAAIPPK